MSDTTPADRDLVNRMLATLGPVLDKVADYIDAAKQNGQLREQLEAARAELAAERDATATDTAGDLEGLQPLSEAVSKLRDMVWPAAEASDQVTPVTDIGDVPAVVDGDLDPADPNSTHLEAPLDGDQP